MKTIWILTFLFVCGCANLKVNTIHNTRVDFTQYKTWCWMNGCEPSYDGPIYIFPKKAQEEIANAIAVQMHEKGFIQGEDDSDLMLDFHIIVKEDSLLDSYLHNEGDLDFWSVYPGDKYRRFLKGTLIIDIIDRKESQMIWRSVTEKYLPHFPKLEDVKIHEGVKKAMKDFPPQSPLETISSN